MSVNVSKIPFSPVKYVPANLALFKKQSFFDGDLTLPYQIYVPENYTTEKKYPLILFFHGVGERGSDNEAQIKNGVGQFFKDPDSPVYDCIVVAPQCPVEYKWVELPTWIPTQYSSEEIPESKPLAAAVKLIEELTRTMSIDTDRIYSTGLSMGAYGTWDLLVRHTDLFAAAIPVCGGVDTRYAERLVDMPIFTFHGDSDKTVTPDGTEEMVHRLAQLDAKDVHCIFYVGGGHGIWENAFSTEGLFDWLLSHRRSDRIK